MPGEYFRRCNSVIAYRIEAINDPNNNIAWIRFFFFFCLSMVNEISNCYKASAVARSHEILKSKDLFLDCYCYKGESFFSPVVMELLILDVLVEIWTCFIRKDCR